MIDSMHEKKVFGQMLSSMTDEGREPFAGWFLSRSASLYPEKAAIICESGAISYRDLYQRVCAVSGYLKSNGVCTGDRVCLLIDNDPFFFIAYYAAWQLGAITVPLNIFLARGELEHIVHDAQPCCIITTQQKESLACALKRQESCFVVTPDTVWSGNSEPVSYQRQTGIASGDLAVLLYTSGTTGFPKGVMLSSKNIVTNCAQAFARIGDVGKERIFCLLPLFHAFSQMVTVWMGIFYGATIILVSKIDRRAITKSLVHQPTIFLGIPPLYGLLCMIPGVSFDRVKYFISGADALPEKIRAMFGLIYRRKICNGYGLTECSPVVALDISNNRDHTNTVGYPLVGIEYRICDDQGNVVAKNTIGTLFLSGDNVMMGYYHDKHATDAVLRDAWLDTGDLAYEDDHGKLVIMGRIKDVIKHKGINIYPQEIENVLMLHSSVVRCAVIGVDDAAGQTLVAYLQVRSDDQGLQKSLHALCSQKLASYKIPRQFICTTKELPLTSTGKVDKKALRI
jgi:long-chain acyl-CoA synthetase